MKTKVTINGVEYNLDLEKAKELGVLEEKDTRCKSWEEFRKKYKNYKGFVLISDIANDKECYSTNYPIRTSEQLTKEETIAITAFSKLLKLRRDWIGDWNLDWTNDSEKKYCIICENTQVCISFGYTIVHPFSFPTKEMAKEFLNCFSNLFEQCKYLI